ncbi:sugar-binding domain-containing protein [Clostridiaceae bacterium 35-E11]
MDIKQNCDIEMIINIQKKMVPEITETFVQRYNLLRLIHYYQPIGRRNLANFMGMGERVIRGEVGILKEQNLIEIKAEGMNTTGLGENTLEKTRMFIHWFKGLKDIEEQVKDKLQIKEVFVIPEFERDPELVIREVGRVTSIYLKSILKQNAVVGITGGHTMAMVAEEMTDEQLKISNVTVVPGRGGLGREVEKQANTIAAKLAHKLKGTYKLLHMPDNISKDILKSLLQDPNVKEAVDCIENIEILVFGIGRADKLAARRGLDKGKIEELLKQYAVAEAFGYYFDKSGRIVQEVDTVGVSLEHYKKLKHVIAAAAGAEKAEAIMAISELNKNLVLVIDESLAKKLTK